MVGFVAWSCNLCVLIASLDNQSTLACEGWQSRRTRSIETENRRNLHNSSTRLKWSIVWFHQSQVSGRESSWSRLWRTSWSLWRAEPTFPSRCTSPASGWSVCFLMICLLHCNRKQRRCSLVYSCKNRRQTWCSDQEPAVKPQTRVHMNHAFHDKRFDTDIAGETSGRRWCRARRKMEVWHGAEGASRVVLVKPLDWNYKTQSIHADCWSEWQLEGEANTFWSCSF